MTILTFLVHPREYTYHSPTKLGGGSRSVSYYVRIVIGSNTCRCDTCDGCDGGV